MRKTSQCGLLWCLLAGAMPALAGDFQDDLKARRERVMQRIGPESMMVLWSAPSRTYSRDIDYEYRQDSNLYYLTGIEQQDTVLILMPGNTHHREILFVRPRDPAREHWLGRFLSREDAVAQSGVGSVYWTAEFEPFLEAVWAQRPFSVQGQTEPDEFRSFFSALSAGTARLFLIPDPKAVQEDGGSPAQRLAARLKDRLPGLVVRNADEILRDLRMVKTPYEIQVLRRGVEIAGEAQKAGMKAARPGAYEYEVRAAIEYVYRSHGALGWSYPPITGSGPNATILHYSKSDRRMEDGDLMLVDAACNFQYLTGDITRTYPVGGRFTPAQKDIYGIVLRAQEEGRKAARPGTTLAEIHKQTVAVIKQGLLDLGLITRTEGDQYRIWYTHGSTHYVGVDVHDVGTSQGPLEPGMTFAMEPGIYVWEGALEGLAKTPDNEAFIARVRPAMEKYKNIGVRIEDTFLVTAEGLECLSTGVPRTMEEVEEYLRSRNIPPR